MKALCIIPARGGSKRIPRKNIRPFRGRPIIAYPIEAALESGCFDEVVVSTDDGEIADVARAHGASVPFLRSTKNASDRVGTAAVFEEVIHEFRKCGRNFESICGLYATAVLTTAEQLRRGQEMLRADPTLTGVIPVLRFSYPVQRALVFRDGQVPMLHPEHYDSRSQDLEPVYHDAGQWYWLNVEKFLATRRLIGAGFAGLPLSEMEAQDIDQEDDWALAELKFQLRGRALIHP
jgi:N-acylneuraminate cytidylyltransferase